LIFNNPADFSGSTLLLGGLLFSFQIYGDFAGYSDIAIGTAKLFGINLLRNFAFPYFSRDIAEFWRRWHISLSTWFRDYLYVPLGGSKGGTLLKVRNTFIIFLVSGFWHGANWTFIVWGFLNALYIMPSIILKTNRNNLDIVAKGRYLPTVAEFFSIVFTFGLTVFAWIFFRATTVQQAFYFITTIFSESFFTLPIVTPKMLLLLLLIVVFMVIEWMGREDQFAIAKLGLKLHTSIRLGIYYALVFAIIYFAGSQQQFIYFQF